MSRTGARKVRDAAKAAAEARAKAEKHQKESKRLDLVLFGILVSVCILIVFLITIRGG